MARDGEARTETGNELMRHGPRFTLKAILGCTAALSVPLALAAAGEQLGAVLLLPVVSGCIGYLEGGWDGLTLGVLLAVLAIPVLLAIVAALTAT